MRALSTSPPVCLSSALFHGASSFNADRLFRTVFQKRFQDLFCRAHVDSVPGWPANQPDNPNRDKIGHAKFPSQLKAYPLPHPWILIDSLSPGGPTKRRRTATPYIILIRGSHAAADNVNRLRESWLRQCLFET